MKSSGSFSTSGRGRAQRSVGQVSVTDLVTEERLLCRCSFVKPYNVGFTLQPAAASGSGASEPAATDTSKTEKKQEESTSKNKAEEDEGGNDNIPLEKTVLDQFTTDMLHGCLEVLTEMPGTVGKACDVLSAVALRNGEEWKKNTMMHILDQVCLQ